MPTSTTKFIEEQVLCRVERTVVAATVITKNRFVKIDTDHTKVTQTFTGHTDVDSLGVAEASCTAAEASAGFNLQVATHGIFPVEAGATITKGQLLTVTSTGAVQPMGSTATVLYQIVGQALTGAASGELCAVRLTRCATWGANAS